MKAKVKSKQELRNSYVPGVLPQMFVYCGKEIDVVETGGSLFKQVDKNREIEWVWHKDWLIF